MQKDKGKFNAIISGTFSLTLSTIILKLLGLIYKVPLATVLGDEGMGYFNSGYTVYSFFYLLCTAGVPKSIMILVCKARAEENKEKSEEILCVASKLFLCVGLAGFLLLSSFSTPLAKLIGNSESAATMVAVAPSIIFISLASVIRGYLSADLRLLEIAVSQIIEGVCKLVIGLAAAYLSAKAGMPTPIISSLTILGVSFGSIASLAYLVIISKIKIKRVKTRQRDTIRQILRISLPITLTAAIMSLTNIIDLGLIMRSLESIGYTEQEAGALYGNYTTLAVPMFNLALAILTPISIAHLPLFTNAISKNDTEALIDSENNSIELSTFIAAPLTIGLITYSKEILEILFPSSEIRIGSALLSLLAPAIILSSFLLIVNNALEAGGRVRAPLISMSMGCVVKIFISILLIKNPSFGISGAPIGTVLSYLTALVISIIIYRVEYDRNIAVTRGFSISMIISIFSILSSRPIYNLLLLKLNKLPSLLITIFFCAVSYFGLYLTYALIKGKGQLKVAKYTNFDMRNCKLET